MSFPVIVIGATPPSISYSELMVDIIFLLVRISYSLMQGVKSNSGLLVDLFHDIPGIFVLSLALTDVSLNYSCAKSNSNALALECHLYKANPASAMICITSTLNLCKLSMLSPLPNVLMVLVYSSLHCSRCLSIAAPRMYRFRLTPNMTLEHWNSLINWSSRFLYHKIQCLSQSLLSIYTLRNAF